MSGNIFAGDTGDNARDNLNISADNGISFQPRLPEFVGLQSMIDKKNIAEWTYERLGHYINEFESGLDEEHEIGARLVTFGQAITFHIEDIGYWGPDIIVFHGINSSGERVQLIQHNSQLSVLLVAVKKQGEKPRRIGFKWKDEHAPES